MSDCDRYEKLKAYHRDDSYFKIGGSVHSDEIMLIRYWIKFRNISHIICITNRENSDNG